MGDSASREDFVFAEVGLLGVVERARSARILLWIAVAAITVIIAKAIAEPSRPVEYRSRKISRILQNAVLETTD